jgi:hypothetical protein
VDGAGNMTVSKESVAQTKKVPESINITAVPAGPTSGDVTVIVEWPVADMEALYGDGWPAGTSVVKQIGIKNPGETNTTWTDITDNEATYSKVVTENGYVFYARLYDGYNYTAQTISLTVNNIDRIKPTGTVFINDDAEEALENAVKLKLTASDNRNDTGFGVKYYYASENPTLNLATAEWKIFNGNGEYDFTLQGTTSMKNVYVWYKDAAGNISDVCSDDVLLVTDNVRLDQGGVRTYYLSLVDAINATYDNPSTASKITIIRNLSQDGPYTINNKKNILIDMRNNSISYTGTGEVVLIKNSGLLTIMMSKSSGAALYAVSNDGEAIGILNNGHVEVIGVSITADSPTGKSTGIKNIGNDPGITMTPIKTYQIIEGADQKVTEVRDVKFKSNAEFDKFESVKVDGVVVNASNYTATPSSTIVTFKSDYIASLSKGTHTLETVSTDGRAMCDFRIAIIN